MEKPVLRFESWTIVGVEEGNTLASSKQDLPPTTSQFTGCSEGSLVRVSLPRVSHSAADSILSGPSLHPADPSIVGVGERVRKIPKLITMDPVFLQGAEVTFGNVLASFFFHWQDLGLEKFVQALSQIFHFCLIVVAILYPKHQNAGTVY